MKTIFGKKSIQITIVIGILAILVGLLGVFIWTPSASENAPALIEVWGEEGSAPGQFREPIGITGQKGIVIISDTGNSRLQIFDEGGKLVRIITHKKMIRPMHITLADEKLYVSEYQNDLILVFSLSGELLQTIGKPGEGDGEFNAPAGVAVDLKGNIYVADFYNHRIQILDKDGNFLRQIGKTGEKGFLPGKFNYPTDVEVTGDQKIVVADAYNDRIQVFSMDGDLIDWWGGPLGFNISGGFNGWFRTATGVGLGEGGTVFVADFFNNRIQKMTIEGEFLSSIRGPSASLLDRPTDSFLSHDGKLYVVDFGNHQVKVFQSQNKEN